MTNEFTLLFLLLYFWSNVFGLKIASIFSLIFMVSAFCLLLPCIYFNIVPAEIFPLAFLSILSIIIGWSMMNTQKNTKTQAYRANLMGGGKGGDFLYNNNNMDLILFLEYYSL